nr:hypothetical protein GCM10025732_18450 [Glycomyces mayteni]
MDVHPNTVEVSIGTDPPGLEFTLDGRPYEATSKRMVVGTEYVLGAESPQYAEGSRFAFAGWSTGAEQQHVFTVPDEDVSVTAGFAELPYPRTRGSPTTSASGPSWGSAASTTASSR